MGHCRRAICHKEQPAPQASSLWLRNSLVVEGYLQEATSGLEEEDTDEQLIGDVLYLTHLRGRCEHQPVTPHAVVHMQ